MDILGQIQADLLDEKVSLSSILRRAKVLAAQLGSEELSHWVSQELDGYSDGSALPDYRVIATAVSGSWTNGYRLATNCPLPMIPIGDERIRRMLSTFYMTGGVRKVEEFARLKEGERFAVLPDLVTAANTFVATDGWAFADMHYMVGAHDFQQILDTVRNRLLDFVLRLGQEWKPSNPPPARELTKGLVRVNIYNVPQGGDVSVFDQRGQQVQYQYNSAGSINIGGVASPQELAAELGKLRAEIEAAKGAGAISADAGLESEHALLLAVRELQAAKPSKGTILDHLGRAKDVLVSVAAVPGLVDALTKAIQTVHELVGG